MSLNDDVYCSVHTWLSGWVGEYARASTHALWCNPNVRSYFISARTWRFAGEVFGTRSRRSCRSSLVYLILFKAQIGPRRRRHVLCSRCTIQASLEVLKKYNCEIWVSVHQWWFVIFWECHGECDPEVLMARVLVWHVIIAGLFSSWLSGQSITMNPFTLFSGKIL